MNKDHFRSQQSEIYMKGKETGYDKIATERRNKIQFRYVMTNFSKVNDPVNFSK